MYLDMSTVEKHHPHIFCLSWALWRWRRERKKFLCVNVNKKRKLTSPLMMMIMMIRYQIKKDTGYQKNTQSDWTPCKLEFDDEDNDQECQAWCGPPAKKNCPFYSSFSSFLFFSLAPFRFLGGISYISREKVEEWHFSEEKIFFHLKLAQIVRNIRWARKWIHHRTAGEYKCTYSLCHYCAHHPDSSSVSNWILFLLCVSSLHCTIW